jgi:cell division protein FtsB
MRRLLPIGFAAFAVASLVIFFFGDSGLSAYDGMSRYENALAANVEALTRRSQELEARLQRLKTDRESTIILARGIGMYEPDDSVVQLAGRPPRSEVYAMGDLLRMRRVDGTRNAALKEAAVGAAFASVIAAFLVALLGRRKTDGSRRRGA